MNKKFTSVNEILKKVMANSGMSEVYYLNFLKQNWVNILNPALANVSEPIKLEKNRLSIKTSTELWRKEFIQRTETILKMINKKLDGYLIEDVEVV